MAISEGTATCLPIRRGEFERIGNLGKRDQFARSIPHDDALATDEARAVASQRPQYGVLAPRRREFGREFIESPQCRFAALREIGDFPQPAG